MKVSDVFIFMIVLLCAISSAPILYAELVKTEDSVADKQNVVQSFTLAALERTKKAIRYDGRYIAIDYPNGDVSDNIGVCTDLIIRSYRQIGLDLQKLVHEDMQSNFELYPKNWELKRPDKNIDHRRVPNLQTFFTRHGEVLALSKRGNEYQEGDLVTWMLPGNLPHIGIVSSIQSKDGLRPLILHNVGSGPELSDFLFSFPMTGHYRYFPWL